jgi:hypothetical protein
MHPIRKQLNHNLIIKALSSVKITVACLVLLFILTLWGTIDQVYNGLYLAQARFFNSWVFTFWGFVPFPGAHLVMWVLFINLTCVSMVRFVYSWSKIGITIIHVGLLLFFVAAFVTLHGVKESNITLVEGEASNVSSAYHHWELSVWTEKGHQKQVAAFDADHLKPGQKFDFEKFGLSTTVKSYYPNCDAYGASPEQAGVLLNGSGIGLLKPTPYDKELEKNSPGGIFHLQGADRGDIDILLYGGEHEPLLIDKGEETYHVMLRRKRFTLPFILRLKDFMMERHPNTDIARSYQSLVEVFTNGVPREALISMNKPLRYKDFTLYQASYSIDDFGREHSTLAVVRNSGRLLPYIATFVTFAGLAIHLLMMVFAPGIKQRKKK